MAGVELIPGEYRYMILTLVLYCFLNIWMARQVLKARKSVNKLIKMARKWQKVAGIGEKRILLPKCEGRCIAEKGHFVAYSSDRKRFVIPLGHLESSVFRELLKMSEEEFGLPRDGPIMLPCDAACLELLLSLMKERSRSKYRASFSSFPVVSMRSVAVHSW
ncbi:hypothetical protein RHMOL_Rhmol05G0057500 [Rhododendron molle]|uniref:Uncharacterized protein n=1 Tax=Rhododendron molle TaxID=49168 RepID=A0ACC0NN85_RHOML|nr:hypothetical protein RHMOL_Rhmol05G0057500 [Rhododendron molle]